MLKDIECFTKQIRNAHSGLLVYLPPILQTALSAFQPFIFHYDSILEECVFV